MTFPYFRNASELNTTLYDSLVESIRRRMLEETEQQREFSQGGELTQQRDAGSFNLPNLPPATLYGGMPKQGAQKLTIPRADRLQAPRASLNPNFRQLVRTSPLTCSFASVSGSPSQLGRPVPTLAGLGMLGRTAPLLPGPTTVPSVPNLPIPETWRSAWKLLQILPELARDAATGSEFGSDQEREQGENEPTTLSREKQDRTTQSSEAADRPENSGRQPQGNDRGPPAGLLGLLLRFQQYQRQQRITSEDDDDEDDRFEKSYQKIQTAKKEREKKKKAYAGGGGGAGSGGGGKSGFWEDYCEQRYQNELNECYRRYGDQEFVSPGHYIGCKKRAEQRRNACRDGTTELAKWGMDPDEEVSINIHR